MTYEQSTHYLDALIDYEKSANFSYASAFKLDRVDALMDHLRDPYRSFRVIHIAGTKGKGSVAVFAEALLRAQGVRTGLFTSPHLVSFRERVRLVGNQIPECLFAQIMTEIEPWATAWQTEHAEDRLSFFDVLTAVGFEAFKRSGVELAVVEVGMGGRLDATNVLNPAVSVITPIALEHTQYLGSTVEAITREKAGIIKSGVPVVIGKQLPEAARVLSEVAGQKGAPVAWLGRDIPIDESSEPWDITLGPNTITGLNLAMLGSHQRWNFAAALAAVQLAEKLPDEGVVRKVANETAAPGRLQLLPTNPPCLLDVAHTPESADCLAQAITRSFGGRHVTLVFSCAADKQVNAIARALAPVADRIVVVPMAGARAMPMADMLNAWREVHPEVHEVPTLGEALREMRPTTGDRAFVVCGSFVLVGAAMRELRYSPQ
jgi:dihydrofolate synthase/folylpolyglutamate synthase